MFGRKISRREFFKSAFVAVISIMTAPLSKISGMRSNASDKEAGHYENLAG